MSLELSENRANAAENAPVARPPSAFEKLTDRSFRLLTRVFALAIVGLVAWVVLQIVWSAIPAIQKHGLGFLTGLTWDPSREQFGILPEIWGTLYSSLLGLGLGAFFGLAIAIVLSQEFLPPRVEVILKNLIELLAAIPSVVYGLWGLFVVVPWLRPAANWLHEFLGWIPLFGTSLSGPGMLPAALVLGIMILPTVSAVSRDALVAVPQKLKEAAYGLGATRWEAILGVIVPTAMTGIFGSIILGFGRALGETMALAMLVGNSNKISVSLFSPGNTLAALLALNFSEANVTEKQVLMYAALVLLAITLVVNVMGTAIVHRASSKLKGIR